MCVKRSSASYGWAHFLFGIKLLFGNYRLVTIVCFMSRLTSKMDQDELSPATFGDHTLEESPGSVLDAIQPTSEPTGMYKFDFETRSNASVSIVNEEASRSAYAKCEEFAEPSDNRASLRSRKFHEYSNQSQRLRNDYEFTPVGRVVRKSVGHEGYQNVVPSKTSTVKVNNASTNPFLGFDNSSQTKPTVSHSKRLCENDFDNQPHYFSDADQFVAHTKPTNLYSQRLYEHGYSNQPHHFRNDGQFVSASNFHRKSAGREVYDQYVAPPETRVDKPSANPFLGFENPHSSVCYAPTCNGKLQVKLNDNFHQCARSEIQHNFKKSDFVPINPQDIPGSFETFEKTLKILRVSTDVNKFRAAMTVFPSKIMEGYLRIASEDAGFEDFKSYIFRNTLSAYPCHNVRPLGYKASALDVINAAERTLSCPRDELMKSFLVAYSPSHLQQQLRSHLHRGIDEFKRTLNAIMNAEKNNQGSNVTRPYHRETEERNPNNYSFGFNQGRLCTSHQRHKEEAYSCSGPPCPMQHLVKTPPSRATLNRTDDQGNGTARAM